MRYKIGDKICIVKNRFPGMNPEGGMDKYLGTIMTIARFDGKGYRMLEDNGKWYWCENAIAGIANDSVEYPPHYCQEGSIECIDEMIAVFGKAAVIDFCLCNVWKYRKRALFKNKEEDMRKSDWYMKKYIELKKGESE